MSIQYTVLGFEPTTFSTQVFTHCHLVRALFVNFTKVENLLEKELPRKEQILLKGTPLKASRV